MWVNRGINGDVGHSNGALCVMACPTNNDNIKKSVKKYQTADAILYEDAVRMEKGERGVLRNGKMRFVPRWEYVGKREQVPCPAILL